MGSNNEKSFSELIRLRQLQRDDSMKEDPKSTPIDRGGKTFKEWIDEGHAKFNAIVEDGGPLDIDSLWRATHDLDAIAVDLTSIRDGRVLLISDAIFAEAAKIKSLAIEASADKGCQCSEECWKIGHIYICEECKKATPWCSGTDENENCDDCEYKKEYGMTTTEYLNEIINLLHNVARGAQDRSVCLLTARSLDAVEVIDAINAERISGITSGALRHPHEGGLCTEDIVIIDLFTIKVDAAILFVKNAQWTGQRVLVTWNEAGTFKYAEFTISDLDGHRSVTLRSRELIKFLESIKNLIRVERIEIVPGVSVEAIGIDALKRELDALDVGEKGEKRVIPADDEEPIPLDHWLLEVGLKCVFRSSADNARHEIYAGERGAAIFDHEEEEATVYVRGGGGHHVDGGRQDLYDESASIIDRYDLNITERDQRIFSNFAEHILGVDEKATVTDTEIKWTTKIGEASLKKRSSHNFLVSVRLMDVGMPEDEIWITRKGASIDQAIGKTWSAIGALGETARRATL